MYLYFMLNETENNSLIWSQYKKIYKILLKVFFFLNKRENNSVN